MTDAVIRAEDLSAGYGKKVVVSGMEICAERGRILTLIGPNGAGKSTVLKTLCRQLAPIKGTVYVGKNRLEDLSANSLARTVSALFTGRVKTEYMRCIDVVEMGRYPYTGKLGLLSDKDREKVAEALKMVDIEELADCDFDRISDGQRQRVLLAGAICREPEVLILDEPTTFLDIKYKLELMSILRRLARERNTAIILSLHELDLAARVSDTIICIRSDKADRIGTPEEIFSGGYIEELYGVPRGSFCEEYGTPELERTAAEPKLFVIGGGGKGIAVYRRLYRRGITFAAGIIHENDIEYPAASSLAQEVVAEKAFEPVSEESYERALTLMKKCGAVICAAESFGSMNSLCGKLVHEAEKLGILKKETENG